MGHTIESKPSLSVDKYGPLITSALLALATGTVVWVLTHISPPSHAHSVKSENLRKEPVRFGEGTLESTHVGSYPKPGEMWKVIIPDGQNQIEMNVEVVQYVMVTYVSSEGNRILPSYCLVKDPETDSLTAIDLLENPGVKFVERISQ